MSFLIKVFLVPLAFFLKIHKSLLSEIFFILSSFAIITLLIYLWKLLSKWQKEYSGNKWARWGLRLVHSVIIVYTPIWILGTIGHIGAVVVIAASDKPDNQLSEFILEDEEIQKEFVNVHIYDGKGNPVYTVINDSVNRESVSLDEVPTVMQNAFVNVEDKDFYSHAGISVKGYVRAFFNNTFNPSGGKQGGSTLTQQLIKNAQKHIQNRNFLHKYQEAALSVLIESKYDKNEILEMYLNRIYLGNGIYGIGTASKYYFNKHVSELTLPEIAYLAGLPQAPTNYTQNLTLGNQRKNTVLSVLEKEETITPNQRKKASQQNVAFVSRPVIKPSSLDAYVDAVLKESKELYGLTEDDLKHKGYHIYTYLNTDLQNQMYRTAQSFSFKDNNAATGKIVQPGIAAVDSNSGKLIAVYGGKDFVRKKDHNRAMSRYQPGSILKPLVTYGPAFESKKWNPFSKVMDKQTTFGNYSPKNAGNVYEGSISIERALIRSANIPAVAVLKDIGVETGIRTLEKMDIPIDHKDKQLHIALGGMEKGVTPVEMAQAYATFQNFGYFEPARAIKYIKDHKGNFVVKTQEEKEGTDIFSAENAYHMTELLKKVITDPDGTGRNANIGRPVAGKTGTAEEKGTPGNRSAWFVGYTPGITMAIHLGFDQPGKERYLTTTGGGDPAILFSAIMKKGLAHVPVKDFQKPSDVTSLFAGPKLEKVKGLEAEYDSDKQHVSLQWEASSSSGGIVYKIYRKGSDGKDIEVGETTETHFADDKLTLKTKPEIIPEDSGWTEKLTLFVKNAYSTTKDLVREKRSYYVVATYQNKQAEASDEISLSVPKVDAVEAAN
ncbi:transglycosylase domain-containing protein [Peribacillus sp. SCS-155]|uniref:transglycosylase domain-containing protein n=1 Tax=Peribacillus sedimenti TaxID=3115297 RepID=UPI0039066450